MKEKGEYVETKHFVISIFLIVLVIAFCAYIITKAVEDFQNDYRCTQMSDEQFFSNPICEKYWDYRRSQ